MASGDHSFLTALTLTDDLQGWTVGWGGVIFETKDGGAHWGLQTSGTTKGLTAVEFTDSSRGWAVGEKNTILVTSDGGAHWTSQHSRPC